MTCRLTCLSVMVHQNGMQLFLNKVEILTSGEKNGHKSLYGLPQEIRR